MAKKAKKTLTKTELIEEVADIADIPKTYARKAINEALDVIMKKVATGTDVQIIGFGSFKAAKRKARTGKNPRTQEKIKIPPKTVPTFKPSKNFKELVNKKK
ncbi:MAG TPA: HU family DNA-binding protein [Thermoplasmata archaeon]|nr:HU family DNA-binding protein [Thermoplasmata archaeon]